MRTTIDIDAMLLSEVMAATGLPTKEATVEEALRRLALEYRRRQAIENLAGLGWDGDLDTSRAADLIVVDSPVGTSNLRL